MDTLVEKFIEKGAIDSTRKSHRTAAREFRNFLLNNILGKKPDRLVLSNGQYEDLRD